MAYPNLRESPELDGSIKPAKAKLSKAAKNALEEFEVAANKLNAHLCTECTSPVLYRRTYQELKFNYDNAKEKLIKHMLK